MNRTSSPLLNRLFGKFGPQARVVESSCPQKHAVSRRFCPILERRICFQSYPEAACVSQFLKFTLHLTVLVESQPAQHALVARAAQAGPGRGIRSVERRLKRWSGQTRRSLNFYAAIDDLHRIVTQANDKPLSAIALEAGYADQSHMGRAVRRATGFSPVQLNRFIESEESFWFYRLAGERF